MYALGSKVIVDGIGRCTVRARTRGHVTYLVIDYRGRKWDNVPEALIRAEEESTPVSCNGAVQIITHPVLVVG